MAKGRVKKEVRDKICNWIESQVMKLLAKGTDASGEPVTEAGAIQTALESASKEFGYKGGTLGNWYQEDKMAGKSLPKKKRGRKKKVVASAAAEKPAKPARRRGRPRKSAAPVAKAPAAPAALPGNEDALALIGELLLAQGGPRIKDREVLVAFAKLHLELRAKDRELAELRSRRGRTS